MTFHKLSFSLLILISAACGTKPKQEANTASATDQADTVVDLNKRPKPDTPRSAADRLVRALYFEHRKKENPFEETKDRALVDQFFAKATADLIWQNQKPSKANLLFNAPDKDVKKAWVLPAVIAGSKAVVFITYEYHEKPVEMRCEMQQQAGRWRITDIVYPDGTRLTKRLS